MELRGKFPQWGWLQGTPDHELRLADACINIQGPTIVGNKQLFSFEHFQMLRFTTI